MGGGTVLTGYVTSQMALVTAGSMTSVYICGGTWSVWSSVLGKSDLDLGSTAILHYVRQERSTITASQFFWGPL